MRHTSLTKFGTVATAFVMTLLGGAAAQAQGQADATGSAVVNHYTPGGANPAPNVFVPLPLPTPVTILVPANSTNRLVLATFSAESGCFQAPGAMAVPSWCRVRIMFNGFEGIPQAGADFAFDSNPNGTATDPAWESHSFQRWIRVTTGDNAVLINVTVERTTSAIDTTLHLDDWVLSVIM